MKKDYAEPYAEPYVLPMSNTADMINTSLQSGEPELPPIIGGEDGEDD